MLPLSERELGDVEGAVAGGQMAAGVDLDVAAATVWKVPLRPEVAADGDLPLLLPSYDALPCRRGEAQRPAVRERLDAWIRT